MTDEMKWEGREVTSDRCVIQLLSRRGKILGTSGDSSTESTGCVLWEVYRK